MNADPRDRTSWREQVEEHLAALGSRSRFADIPQDRLARGRLERILLGVALLGPSNANRAVLPVDTLQAKRGDLAAPQAIDAQQQEYGAVADVVVAAAPGTSHQSSDGRPLQAFLQPLMGIHPRGCHADC